MQDMILLTYKSNIYSYNYFDNINFILHLQDKSRIFDQREYINVLIPYN